MKKLYTESLGYARDKLCRNGVTLAEILVVLAVLSLMGVLVVTIFTRTLRGANKSQILSSIKQNGQVILETMDKTIRSSDNLVCVSSEPDNTIVVEKAGVYTRYRFMLDPTGTTNGVVWQDNPVLEADEVDFINGVCSSTNLPMEEAVILSDTNSQTGVKIISGSFKNEDPKAGFKNIVTVNFDLGPGVQAPKAVAGQIDPVTFQTTIQLRNLK